MSFLCRNVTERRIQVAKRLKYVLALYEFKNGGKNDTEKCTVHALPSHSLRGCGSKRVVLLYFCPVGHVCALHCLLLGGLVACCYVKCMKMNVLNRRPGPAHEACPLRHVGAIKRHTPRRSDLNLAPQWAPFECPTHAKAQLSARLQ